MKPSFDFRLRLSPLLAVILGLTTATAFAGKPTSGPRPIGQDDIPLIISVKGSYYLDESITADSGATAITITANHVTLDLRGHVINGQRLAKTGIGLGYAQSTDPVVNVQIMNGTITGFTDCGIETRADAACMRIIDIRALENGYSGIYLTGVGHLVRGCTAAFNARTGISVEHGSLVQDCVSVGSGSAGLSLTSGAAIDNVMYGNGSYAGAFLEVLLDRNTAIGNEVDAFKCFPSSTEGLNHAPDIIE